MNTFRQHLGVALMSILSLCVTASAQQSVGANASAPVDATSLPDSPGAVQAPAQYKVQYKTQPVEIAQADSPSPQSSQPASPSNSANQSKADQKTQQPVGTAAAQPVPTTGNAASEPAGIAIAPAKQRRTRTMLIKVGAILGASAAIATTVALSKASPSKPPGAP